MKPVKLGLICCIFFQMAALPARTAENSIEKLAQDPACARGLDWIMKNGAWATEQQIRLTEIPAPEMNEAQRGEYLKDLFKAAGLKVKTDKPGNVIVELPGSDPSGVILLVAHLDTVFPENTDVKVKRKGARLEAPGISDNGAGLAALSAMARALTESGVRTVNSIVLAGDVGEEGEGNLRGIRALVETYGPRLKAVIAIDGASTDHITSQGIASRRFEITVKGPGGHSWSDFGEPNPITAIARGIVKFAAIRLPENLRSSFNFGVIEGGTSINSIPDRAIVKVDLRSEDEAALNRMESYLRDAMQAGIKDEMSAMNAGGPLNIEFRSLGSRPAGVLPENSPLLATMRDVDRFLGNRSRTERSSTDANLPLSLGIPALALGGGGKGGGAHTLAEWYSPEGRELGLKRLFLLTVALSGIQSN
jgi:acetylornithine deacetylase/succinyl-diaminopimelate desuccinylase-like protein